MGTIGLYVIVALLPTAAGGAVIGVFRGWRWLSERRRRPAPPEPLDSLAARIRRLRAELEATENSPGATAKRHHVRALRAAYADVLAVACHRLGVSPPPGGERAALADVYRAEAALRARGLEVAEPAPR